MTDASETTGATLIGASVGNYRVVSLLGAGAMGEVYLGEHPDIGRRVAIKVVMGSLSASAEISERFLSEARAVSKLNHRNIIQIFDFGTLPDGRLYYVMEYLDGQDLSALLQERAPLPPHEAAALLRQITVAMEAAHAAGIVHRDLKPDNIFVAHTDAGPLVKILDFGIAKLLEPAFGSESHTATGMIMGTPMYMSPEQAAGDVSQISPRTDIYALGVIAYEMLSGRCPFVAKNTAQVLTMHIAEPPPPLRTHVSNLPPALETFIQVAMAKTPADRHRTMTDFYTAFQHAAGDAPQSTAPGLGGVPPAQLAHDDTVAGDPGLANTMADTDAGLAPDTTLGRAASESVPHGVAGARSRRKGWVIALGVLLTGATAGTAWCVLQSRNPTPKERSPSAATAPQPDAAPAAQAMEPQAKAPMPPPARRPRPGVRRIRVSSKSGRLKVRVTLPNAPTYHRKTPFTVDARQGERVVLVASRLGYRSETRTLTVSDDRPVVFKLTRLARSHPGMKRGSPTGPAMRPPPPPAMPPMERTKRYGESTISPFGMK